MNKIKFPLRLSGRRIATCIEVANMSAHLALVRRWEERRLRRSAMKKNNCVENVAPSAYLSSCRSWIT